MSAPALDNAGSVRKETRAFTNAADGGQPGRAVPRQLALEELI